MENLSGLVLDRQDDPSGLLLSEENVKVAADTTPYARLPDHLFALCMRQDGEELRKFAMHSSSATAESILYFLKCGHRLPDEAQKVAAQNLIEGAGWYDLPCPEPLKKVAFLGAALRGAAGSAVKGAIKDPLGSLGKAAGGAMTLGSLAGTAGAIKQNLGQAGAAGGSIVPLGNFGG